MGGLKATSNLAKRYKNKCDIGFNPNQALLAARAGASYEVLLGRFNDITQNGIALVAEIAGIFDYHDIPTEIIAASIRTPIDVVESAKAGADIATIPFKVLEQMIKHPLTDIGIQRFLDDWKKVSNK